MTSAENVQIDDAVVGFVDILGFKSMVRAPGDRSAIARELDDAIVRALEHFGGIGSLAGLADAEWRVRVFTDCIAVAKPASDLGVIVMLDALANFTKSMIESGFFIRGGVAMGPYFESRQLLFSEAQIEAYELESTTAMFPRIALSPDLVARIESFGDQEMRLAAKEYVLFDAMGIAFLNYLVFDEDDAWRRGHEFYLRQRDALRAELKRGHPDRIRVKYRWIAEYHDWSLRQTAQVLKCSGLLCEETVWSFASLLVDRKGPRAEFECLLWSEPCILNEAILTDMGWVDWVREWPGASTEDDEDSDGD